MKPFLGAVMVFFTALAFGAPASPSVSAEKLHTAPITIYPNFDARDTAVVTIFNGFARADDALVVSYRDAFKGAFRVADVGVTRGQVWVYVPRAASLGQTYRKNVDGARGVVFVPDEAKRTNLRYVAEQLADEAKTLGVPLIVGLDDRDTATLDNVAEIARNADVITICASSRLHGTAAGYRTHVARVVRTVREVNPAIKVELAIIATMDKSDRAPMLALVAGTADLADRIAIYCDPNAESLESLKALLAALRPDGA